jgi:MFS family permease
MKPQGPLVLALGVAQVVSWGSLFYSIGVLGPAMSRDVGVSEVYLFGAFTAGLLVSGAAAPLSGRLVDRRGGRFVLAIGSVLGAVAMGVLALATHPATLLFGWLVAGAAMSACLYDTAFATLSQHTSAVAYRRAVTVLTILGGFASTVFWPLSQVLMDGWGWRAALGVYAGLHLFLCLPIHLGVVPRGHAHSAGARAMEPSEAPRGRPGLGLLNASFVAASFVSAVVAVHVVSLLVAQGLTQTQAVSVAMLIGPMQVAGRIAEFGFASRLGVRSLGVITFGLFCVAFVALLATQGLGAAAIAFVVTFGCANGLFTIIRGTTPMELYGREGLGTLLGHLASASLYARALAPACFSGMLALGLMRNAALAILGATALGSLALYLAAERVARSVRPRRDGD